MQRKKAEQAKFSLKSDCSTCFGLCCVALYFSKMDGFPKDKECGQPCHHLRDNFKCAIHDSLSEKGYNGCMGFDCLGAGQKISTQLFSKSWKEDVSNQLKMFELLPLLQQWHELLWYLYQMDAQELMSDKKTEIQQLYGVIEVKTLQDDDVLNMHLLHQYRMQVNVLLVLCSERARQKAIQMYQVDVKKQQKLKRGANLMGRDLSKMPLMGANLRGAFLIGANLTKSNLCGTDLLGADLRGTLIHGADLSESLFLTQQQLNSAIGNEFTKIPSYLTVPRHWKS